jgi:biotin carboxyl carrier protein
MNTVRGDKIETLQQLNVEQTQKIETLEEENADLTSLREELTEKVTILSDTINQKVEEEEAQEEAQAQAHMPVGFPMSASASLEEADTEEPMVKLNGTEGSSVIASGDGTVLSITTDTNYLHCIKIDHGNGYISIYRNDGDAMVKEGDEVVRGAILYVIGEDNAELGYQVTYDDRYMDPMDLINIDG